MIIILCGMIIVKHHVYSDKRNDHNVMLHDYNVMQHHYDVKRHHSTVKQHEYNVTWCAADFSLLNLPKGKSLGRSKPATNS